jgi:hypothetical protein
LAQAKSPEWVRKRRVRLDAWLLLRNDEAFILCGKTLKAQECLTKLRLPNSNSFVFLCTAADALGRAQR